MGDYIGTTKVISVNIVEDAVDEALCVLNAINTDGRIEYSDYCKLHDAISAIFPTKKEVDDGYIQSYPAV